MMNGSSTHFSLAMSDGEMIKPKKHQPRITNTTRSRIYIPKALCLLSRYPFYDYFSEIIEDLYSASKTHMINIIEAYINKLVLECPSPPRGLVKVQLERFSRPGTYIELTQPPINELPYVNRTFFYILMCNMSLEQIIEIFTNLLLEKPVIIPLNHHLRLLLWAPNQS